MANAFSFDEEKIIEGFEYRDKSNKPFLLCVQWHPERMKDREQNPFSKNIKEHFIAAVKTNNPG
jgi:putative glutamine amidotransferase